MEEVRLPESADRDGPVLPGCAAPTAPRQVPMVHTRVADAMDMVRKGAPAKAAWC